MLGFVILVGFQLLGVALHRVGVPLPGSVLGLLLFTTALAMGLVDVKWVERTAGFLVRHMILLFIPVLAGITQMSAELRRDGVALVGSLVLSLLAVILTTGGLAHFLLRDPEILDAMTVDPLIVDPKIANPSIVDPRIVDPTIVNPKPLGHEPIHPARREQ